MKLKDEIKESWQEYKRVYWEIDKFILTALLVTVLILIAFIWASGEVWEHNYQESGCAAYEDRPAALVPVRCIEWFD